MPKVANCQQKEVHETRKLEETAEGILAEFSIEEYDAIRSHHTSAREMSYDSYNVLSFEPLHFLQLGVTIVVLNFLHARVKCRLGNPKMCVKADKGFFALHVRAIYLNKSFIDFRAVPSLQA